MKKCRTCTDTKPIEEFALNNVQYGRPYYKPDCLACLRRKTPVTQTSAAPDYAALLAAFRPETA